MTTARITGHGAAYPPPVPHAALWDGFFKQHYDDNRLAGKVWQSAGIETRHAAVDPREEDLSQAGTAERMRRFVAEALPLAHKAVLSALDDAGLDAADVGLLSVVSCTGYATPGLDILLARDLGMSDEVQRLHIGHMGCYAAVPGLAAVTDFVVSRGKPAVLVCAELTTLHVQPATDEVQQMVAHALFADAVTAVVVTPADVLPGLDMVDTIARTDSTTMDQMTWDVTDLGFRMGLSPQVPDTLGIHVESVVDSLLSRNGLSRADVTGWAIHPGGRRIVEVVGDKLGLTEEDLSTSYGVLRDIGNCSSATVLVVLERLVSAGKVPSGSYAVAMAFGPGLTLYASLLRAS